MPNLLITLNINKKNKLMKRIFLPLLTCVLSMGLNAQTVNGVSPNSAEKGTWSLPVTISGSGTSFSNATSTVVRIKQGNQQLEIVSVNAVTAESVDVNVRVSNLKPLGSYSVEVFDANLGLIAMPNGFTVSVNTEAPSLVMTTPESGAINQMLPVTISLQNTNFAQATDNTMYLTQGTQTIMPIPGSIVALNDNYIKALFDLNNPLISIGNLLNAHCGNSHDGYFSDNLAINITQLTNISGVVIYGSIYNGVVELYQKNSTASPNTYSLVATANIDGSNAYVFNGVADAQYLLRSVPVNMPDIVATYFPNHIDWTAATEINSDPILSINKDITPITSISLNGVGSVNGAIGWGPNGFTKASIVMADGVEVFLKNTDLNTYAQAITDMNGVFEFISIPDGNYQIVINLPGYTQISSYDFIVNTQDTDFSDLDFLIDDNQIFKSGFLTTSSGKSIEELVVYPNPTNGELFIRIPEVITDFNVSIFNQLGQNVWERNVTNHVNQNYFADISNVENGVYFVTVQNDKSVYKIKVIKR